MNAIFYKILIVILSLLFVSQTSLAAQTQTLPDRAFGKKVLVVASYHPEFKWEEEIVHSLELYLAGAEITVFYMDTKRNLDGAEKKAAEAYRLYQEIQPDAVITIDDNAQAYFVVPYLKDKVDTPVIFCGVNDDASKYGFPAGNVTGVVEKKHYRESISFAQFVKPEISRITVLYSPSPSNLINLAQIENEKDKYTAEIVASVEVKTLADVLQAAVNLEDKADAVILLNLTGIVDEENKQLEGHEVIRAIAEKTHLVTIVASDWEVEAGALCGVIKSGEEQGSLAAELLLAYWGGLQMNELSVTQNKNGRRFLNLSTLNRLNIPLRPAIIVGTKIVPGK